MEAILIGAAVNLGAVLIFKKRLDCVERKELYALRKEQRRRRISKWK